MNTSISDVMDEATASSVAASQALTAASDLTQQSNQLNTAASDFLSAIMSDTKDASFPENQSDQNWKTEALA